MAASKMFGSFWNKGEASFESLSWRTILGLVVCKKMGDARLDQCGILIALPINRTEFQAGTNGEYYSDYCNAYHRMDFDKAWANHYSDVCEAFDNLITFAREAGAFVKTKAAHADLCETASRYKTIIVFAHQKGYGIGAGDIIDSDEVKTRIAGVSDSLAGKIDRYEASDSGSYRDALNMALASNDFLQLLPRSELELVGSSSNQRAAISRDILDEIAKDALRPGNKIEFFDGLIDVGDAVDSIESGVTEVVDFVMCNSHQLALISDLTSNNTITFLSRPELTAPKPEIVSTHLALRLLVEEKIDYARARAIVARELTTELGDL